MPCGGGGTARTWLLIHLPGRPNRRMLVASSEFAEVFMTARKSIAQLGWPHYWLLVATLGGILGLIAFVLLISARA